MGRNGEAAPPVKTTKNRGFVGSLCTLLGYLIQRRLLEFRRWGTFLHLEAEGNFRPPRSSLVETFFGSQIF